MLFDEIPWHSSDPDIRKYYEASKQNVELDEIIALEFKEIET